VSRQTRCVAELGRSLGNQGGACGAALKEREQLGLMQKGPFDPRKGVFIDGNPWAGD
jgi:hypothetical protein